MRLTKDDERARRICALALDFMSARAPIPSSELARAHYAGLSTSSFQRSFSRDRALLAACGVHVISQRRARGESLWEIDEQASYAEGAGLGAREAAVLETACQGLLDDGSFPFDDDLRLALAKIGRSFADAPSFAASPTEGEARQLTTLRRAVVGGTCARVTYTDARGRTSHRLIAPYGLFGLGGETYLVAEAMSEDGEALDGTMRTYRVDRFDAVEEVKGMSASVPPGFSVEDWARLPFQLGPETWDLEIEVPAERAGDGMEAMRGQGEVVNDGGILVWHVSAADLDGAARWAVSQGLRPRAPQELVDAWASVLREAAEDDA